MRITFESRVRVSIMSGKAFRKFNIFLSIFCLAITLMSLILFNTLMNKSYV
ncbi:GGDEF domain-containing protein, partial [Vibrio sp. 10N.286.49.E1]